MTSPLNIDQSEIETKKVIGKIGHNDVLHVKLKGGLHLVLTKNNGNLKVLAAAPHFALARFVAKKDHKDVEWNELQKHEDDPIAFAANQDLLYKLRDLVQKAINGASK